MRPDFQCGICHDVVPEFYYGGCCSVCARIRCNNCMRTCAVCGLNLCPECEGVLDAGPGRCTHRLPPPRTPFPGERKPSAWKPPPRGNPPPTESE